MRKAIVIAAAVLAVPGQSDSKAVQATGARAATAIKVGSSVASMRIVATTRLPSNPKRVPVDEYCSAYAITKPKTAGGRLAVRNGWIVTSETKLGKYDAVTFVGALKRAWIPATCAHVNGNLAVFDGPQLKAIAYEQKQSEPADPSLGVEAEDSFSLAEQIDGRRIRLSWGLPSPPFADMVLRDGIFIEPIAAKDPVCGGAATVPNVFGEDIRKARKKLMAFGWRPERPSSEDSGDPTLNRQGVIEVETCSGSGYGFCGFNYRHKKGFGLSVVSTGDGYPVIGYGAQCSGRRNRGGKG